MDLSSCFLFFDKYENIKLKYFIALILIKERFLCIFRILNQHSARYAS